MQLCLVGFYQWSQLPDSSDSPIPIIESRRENLLLLIILTDVCGFIAPVFHGFHNLINENL